MFTFSLYCIYYSFCISTLRHRPTQTQRGIQTMGNTHTNDLHERGIHIRFNTRDSLFRALFGDESRKKNTLELYNAINNSHYTDENDITITTIENAIYLDKKNDVSFLLESTMSLYEHQSTYNPNMPLRGLFYLSRLYEKYIAQTGNEARLYTKTRVRLPTPKYVVFYNGADEKPDRMELKLTDAFDRPEESCLEVTAIMLNINHGRNRELMEKCQTLRGYALFFGKVEQYLAQGLTKEEAVTKAVDDCIKEGILRDYLEAHRAEVIGMITKQYTEEEIHQMFFKNGFNEGHDAGFDEGHNAGFDEGHDAGILSVLSSLVSDGTLTLKDAATRAGLSEDVFSEKMKNG